MADITLAVGTVPATPAASSATAYFDTTTKKLASVNDAGTVHVYGLENANSVQQSLAAADTYVNGASLLLPSSKLAVGAWVRWVICLSKNATGTSTPIVNVRFGTGGVVADTARLTFTFAATTAATDSAVIELWMNCVSIGASGVIQGTCRLIKANTTNTGFSAATAGTQSQTLNVTSGAFDTTVANSIVGISINPGTGTYTVTTVILDAGGM